MQAPFVLASVFGSLPGFMFLSAFSVLLFTFARIFHTVLRAGQSKHRFTFRVLAVFLILINVGQYSLAGVQYSLDYRNMDDTVVALPIVLVLVFGACVIGILFSVYSVMLYQNYNVLIQNARAEVARSQRAVPPTVYGNTDVQSADVQTTVLVNPMRRLAYAACLTSLCFLARAGFLLYRYYSNSHQEGLSSAGYIEYVAYFFSAEVHFGLFSI
jgi:multisubunit Na+/H+ antiporter MnhC subunit